jgi:hypothetical protein
MTPAQIAAKMASGHSVFSPSGAEMSMTCLEALVINALAEDNPTFEAAEGTVAHGCGEEWINTGERPDKWIGSIETVNNFDIEITEEMLEFVGDFVRKCEECYEWAEHSFSERHVDISDLTPIPNQGGTMDFGAMAWQTMKIIDLKYGKEPVFAYDFVEMKPNKQLAIYAWGLFLEWDWLYNFQEITICISQPRLPGGYSEYTMTRQELIDFADYARERWALAWTINPGRTPSIKGCRWCAVQGTCSAAYRFLADNTAEEFMAWDEDGNPIETEVISEERMLTANDDILDEFALSPWPKQPNPKDLNTKAMEKLLRYRRLMETFFNAISQELLSRAISDEEELTWWKLVMSRTRRKWVDDEDFIVEALERAGLKPRFMYKTVMLSPAEMERMLHTKLKMPLTKAKKLLEEAGLAIQPPGQKTLALRSDNRKALPKDTDVFDNWDED